MQLLNSGKAVAEYGGIVANLLYGLYCSDMAPNKEKKPLNKTERLSTVDEFKEYCAAEKESRLNSGNEFDTSTFDKAVEVALQKLAHLQKEGWT